MASRFGITFEDLFTQEEPVNSLFLHGIYDDKPPLERLINKNE